MRRRVSDTYTTRAYNTAREYPGTIAAVIVGIGITAALLWAVRRSGGWQEFQTDAKDALRQGYDYARQGYDSARDGIERIRSRQPELSE
jgi:hypothetical protein